VDDPLVEILNLCVAIDEQAAAVYRRLSGATGDAGLRDLCAGMADEEEANVRYWRELLDLAQQGRIPQVFEEPEKVKADLETVAGRVAELARDCAEITEDARLFLLAYRLEFYLLYPAFETLMYFSTPLTGEKTPMDDYEGHISRLVRAFRQRCQASPEMELLGETLHRLWAENRQLVSESATDPLTGVYNRRGFFNVVAILALLANRNGNELGVLMLDVDGLKQVNDAGGHDAGDRALRAVADCVLSRVRRSDVVGRYGGDEFAVCLSRVDSTFLLAIAEDLRKAVEAAGVGVTVSIGVSHCIPGPDTRRDIDELVRRADRNLYRAKSAGRNRVAGDEAAPP